MASLLLMPLLGRGVQSAKPGHDSAHRRASVMQTCVAFDMSDTLTHSNGPWMFCMPVKRFGQGTPISVSRDPSVPPRVGVENGVTP